MLDQIHCFGIFLFQEKERIHYHEPCFALDRSSALLTARVEKMSES